MYAEKYVNCIAGEKSFKVWEQRQAQAWLATDKSHFGSFHNRLNIELYLVYHIDSHLKIMNIVTQLKLYTNLRIILHNYYIGTIGRLCNLKASFYDVNFRRENRQSHVSRCRFFANWNRYENRQSSRMAYSMNPPASRCRSVKQKS